VKGLILTYIISYGSALVALVYPLIGLYVYVGLSVLRPQFIFGWAGDISGVSFVVGASLLVGWVFNGFGSWRIGRGFWVLLPFVGFVAWFAASASTALNSDLAYDALYEYSKVIFPFLAGVTLLKGEKEGRQLLWVMVLAQGYVGFEQNLNYLKGFNTAAEGFGGMDNNFFGLSLVTLIGPAITLTLAAKTKSGKLIAAAATALILHTTLLTFSRGAMLGMVAVGAAAFVLMPKRPKYIFALIAVFVLAASRTGPQLTERYGSVFASEGERDGSSQSRLDLWADCLNVIEDYPILGVGPANWRTIAARFGWAEGKSAHSVWMETAAEEGIPGVLLLLTFFCMAIVRLWPLARQNPTDENRYEIAVASGVILSIVGFIVSGQFVSAPALEVPYYVTMLGIPLLRSKRPEVATTTAVVTPPAVGAAPNALGPVPIGRAASPAFGQSRVNVSERTWVWPGDER
jgi:probable O-glycosylation ligase (exosortase A-associated)